MMFSALRRALATSLRCVRASSGSRPVELLRKESLAGLAPAAAARVLSHAYAAVVPIAPLPYPPLPLAPNRPGRFLRTAEVSLRSGLCTGWFTCMLSHHRHAQLRFLLLWHVCAAPMSIVRPKWQKHIMRL